MRLCNVVVFALVVSVAWLSTVHLNASLSSSQVSSLFFTSAQTEAAYDRPVRDTGAFAHTTEVPARQLDLLSLGIESQPRPEGQLAESVQASSTLAGLATPSRTTTRHPFSSTNRLQEVQNRLAAQAASGRSQALDEKRRKHFLRDFGFEPLPQLRDESKAPIGPPVWLMVLRPAAYMYVVYPILATLKEALHLAGVRTETAFLRGWIAMRDRVLAAARQGETPVVIVFGWSDKWCEDEDRDKVRRLANHGAYVILYNTEPHQNRMAILPTAFALGAREVWDYSRGMLSTYAQEGPNITKRHMPPGCARALDYHAEPKSISERDEEHIGFLGAFFQRSPEVRGVLARSGRLELAQARNHAATLITQSAWQEYLRRLPMQLNLHTVLNPLGAFESFRVSVLLANKACVYSGTSHPLDEELWQGMVRFVNESDVLESLEPLWGNTAAITECQEQQHQRFCERLNPKRILEESGFLEKLVELR